MVKKLSIALSLLLMTGASSLSGRAALPKGEWTLHRVSSEETVAEDGRAVNAFDDDPSTIWHTRWSGTAAAPPHDIEIDLGAGHPISGFRYTPPRGGVHGHIGNYQFFVSSDGHTWSDPVASGTFTASPDEKQVAFLPQTGRFVRLRIRSEARGLAGAAVAELSILSPVAKTESLPYDRTNPVVLHNDDAIDTYTDEYLLALSSAGEIDLRAMITGSPVAPHNPGVTLEYMLNVVQQRSAITALASASGFARVPRPVVGALTHLVRPESGVIEETAPLGSNGSRAIVAHALAAIPSRPLVVVAGGPLTDVADAYLLNHAVADRLVVAWLGGTRWDMWDYNGVADAWASYIVLERLRLVQFPANEHAPHVPKAKLPALPPTPLREWMIAKQHPNGLPSERDSDAPPAIALMRPDYVTGMRRVSFGTWITRNGQAVPGFRDDRNGRALVVTSASVPSATAEWWRALTNPDAYPARTGRER